MPIVIDGKQIGDKTRWPYIVAEVSGNHGGVKANCYRLIDAAKWAGADAVKFQCYEPSSITIDAKQEDFTIQDGPWQGRTLYELYEKNHTPFEWFPDLFAYAEAIGISAFSSVFCFRGLELLESLKCPAYKIASMEIGHLDLIRGAAATGKPVIISTGMASNDEIFEASKAAKGQALLLHCVSGYPTPISQARLGMINRLSPTYGPIGISDHSKGPDIPVLATAMGAALIEKHICLPDVVTDDSKFSLTPEEFIHLHLDVDRTWRALQTVKAASEDTSRQLKRSLYVVRAIDAGEMATQDNVQAIRPGYGYPPNKIHEILGKRAKEPIAKGTRAHPDLFE